MADEHKDRADGEAAAAWEPSVPGEPGAVVPLEPSAPLASGAVGSEEAPGTMPAVSIPLPTAPIPDFAARDAMTSAEAAVATHALPRPGRRLLSLRAVLLALLLLGVVALPLLYALADARAATGARTPVATATPATTATPARTTPTPHVTPNPQANAWMGAAVSKAELTYVNGLIAHMSLDEEIGQMIMIEFEESAMTPGLAYEVSHYHVGSVILYAYNVLTPDQTRQLAQGLQANARIPLFISTDQEGGPVNRLYSIDGPLPSAEQMGATNDPSVARRRGEQDAQQLYQLGINANMAPVVDVRTIPDGEGALGGRMFGTTPAQVTTLAGAYLAGLQDSQQVVGCVKHFPGLGDVPVDPHVTLPTLNRSLADLNRIDWAPYRSLIATGQVGMVMVTHEVVPAVDPTYPSSLSHALITGVLRNQLHFGGVVVTDGIYMKSLAQHYSFDQIVLLAVEAGVDIISSTYSLSSTDSAEQVIRDAVANGTLSKARIDDSVRRILLLKLRYGLLTAPHA